MSDAIGRNRLDEEASPYLRQHADNPVDWQPWDEAALSAAREDDRPIFLSVGYAACHWCHVMEEESFEDRAVADALNESFVPIKVDREERPDIDRIYQTICAMVTRGGGWPLSVFLTPDGRPFYVGTYFPKEGGRNRPGFLDLVSGLAEAWETDREGIEERADEWMAAIRGELEAVGEPGDPGEGRLDEAAAAAVRSADREHGGFGGGGPKFPQTSRIEVLLRAHARTGDPAPLEVATETLTAMTTRGLFDHVGGGFHRYATDREWTVPHFEKMLYDNAEVPRVLLGAYQLTGEARYADAVRETLSFLDRQLSHPAGGFYSTLDADSETGTEREEGAFYVWTPDEVRDAVEDATAADLFLDRYGVTEGGNFEGKNVLAIERGIESLAEEYDLSPSAVEGTLAAARADLFEARAERPRPARDEKVLAGWNGLAVSAVSEAAVVLDPAYGGRAEEALSFVREHLWDGERLSRRFKDGDVAVDGYLEDYAFLARGALDTYGATGDPDHLGFALDLAGVVETEFWDAEAGTLYFTPASGEALAARPQELSDQSTPSSVGVAVETLLALSHFVDHGRFEAIAERTLETHASRIASNPLEHASIVLAADRYENGSSELTVVADDVPADWRERIGETYLPARLLAPRPPDLEGWLDRLDLEAAPPIWAGRDGRGEPTVYACRDFACSPPETDIDAALAWFDGLEGAGVEE